MDETGMTKVLVASKNTEEIAKFRKSLEETFEVFSITAPDYPKEALRMFDIVLIDHNFTEHSGIDYLNEVTNAVHIPVLMLTPPDDASCAIEAIRAGAFNYVVKFGHYDEILPIAIHEAIARFSEHEKMKETIVALKERIAELEALLGNMRRQNGISVEYHSSSGNGTSGRSNNVNVVKEIVNRFRQGEINLPSLPQINRKFEELINRGADYRQISDLLKQDLAIASKLIMVSNSVFYRGVEINRTLEQAVSRLGISVTRQYVNVISNRALYTVSKKKYLPMIERLWRHSLASAFACQLVIATRDGKEQFDNDIFITGLLHDIGKLILIQVISELEVKGKFAKEIPVEDVVKIAETYHGQFGSALLKRWQFSNECIGVAQYHDNLRNADPISGELLVAHLANQLAKASGFMFADDDIPDIGMSESAQSLKIGPEAIGSMKNEIVAYMDEVGKMLA